MGVFKFPEKIPLTRRLKDVLEDEVPEKFYISSDKAQRLLESLNATYRLGKESDQIVKAGTTPGYRRVNTVIDPSGVSPTLAARDYKDPLRVLVGGSCLDATVGFDGASRVYTDSVPTLRAGRSGLMVVEDDSKIMQIGNFVTTGNFRNPQRGRVYDPEGLAPTLHTGGGGDTMPHIIEPVCAADRGRNPENPGDCTPGAKTVRRLEINYTGLCNALTTNQTTNLVIEPVCAASRGRNPENPGDRTPGTGTEQRLEVNREGLCNTITTVQKDNYILEPAALRPERTEYGKQIRKAYENGEITEKRSNMRKLSPRDDGITNTLTTVQKDNYIFVPPFRIRKLTPRECWRLQGFTDEDFDRAAAGASNSQLYKMAGNSIAVPCLEAIFRNLLEGQHALLEVIRDSI